MAIKKEPFHRLKSSIRNLLRNKRGKTIDNPAIKLLIAANFKGGAALCPNSINGKQAAQAKVTKIIVKN